MTPEERKQREERQEQLERVGDAIRKQMRGGVSCAEAKRYWTAVLDTVPTEVVAEALAIFLPTTQAIEHALMKELLSRRH